MGIKAIPVPIQGDSHSVPCQFPIVSSIPIPMGFPVVISAVNIERHHCLVFTGSLVFCTIFVNELYSLACTLIPVRHISHNGRVKPISSANLCTSAKEIAVTSMTFNFLLKANPITALLHTEITDTTIIAVFDVPRGPVRTLRYVTYDNRIVVQRH